jgi:N-ethylmaleimide reductase
MSAKLFSPYRLGNLELSNRTVMAPMTRCRALGNVPNALIAEYYAQRAGAGLIISEGTSPSSNGLGYARIPGLYSEAQVAGWKTVTDAVHAKGSKIFVQLMHTGRVSNQANMPEGARVLAPSAVTAAGEIWTDAQGQQPHTAPQAMTAEDIQAAIDEFARAASNAIRAGFDGVELHGANGYLLEQFFRPTSNQRTDAYGGSVENRARFILEAIGVVTKAIGADKVGIRLSPFGVNGDMPLYPEMEADYFYLVEKIAETGIVYLHLADHSAMGAPEIPSSLFAGIRKRFPATIIRCGNYQAESGEAVLASGEADLVAFGRPFISNPDLVERLQKGLELKQPDFSTLYSMDEKGFTDY